MNRESEPIQTYDQTQRCQKCGHIWQLHAAGGCGGYPREPENPYFATLPTRCGCRERALRRRLFVDSDGFWTWLCWKHFLKAVGWHD